MPVGAFADAISSLWKVISLHFDSYPLELLPLSENR
jgi:hypothetical protein